ncbi:MAG: cobalamin-dependent protein [Planctomycetes bacterium]|nr:cobalamin-dependent protein [Planctomycetota bacterium]
MKILLINPAFNKYGGVSGHGGTMMPLNLAYIASYTRKHLDCKIKILDAEILAISHEQSVEQACAYSPNLIGITANTCVFDSVITLCALLKAKLPNVPIALGGPHPSALPEQSLLDTGADYSIMGEGEISFAALAKSLMNNSPIQAIAGIAWRGEEQHINVNPSQSLIENLDLLPFPARDLLDNQSYRPPPNKKCQPWSQYTSCYK